MKLALILISTVALFLGCVLFWLSVVSWALGRFGFGWTVLLTGGMSLSGFAIGSYVAKSSRFKHAVNRIIDARHST